MQRWKTYYDGGLFTFRQFCSMIVLVSSEKILWLCWCGFVLRRSDWCFNNLREILYQSFHLLRLTKMVPAHAAQNLLLQYTSVLPWLFTSKKKNIYLLPWLSWFQWMTAMPLTPGTKCSISVLSCIFSDTLWRRTNIWWNDVSYKCRNRFNFSVFFQVCLHHCCNMKCKDVQIKKILHSGCECVGIVLM